MPATTIVSSTITLPSDREILMTRAFDAPRELVFEAMTKPEHVRNGGGPAEPILTVCEIDFRVGRSMALHRSHSRRQEMTFTRRLPRDRSA